MIETLIAVLVLGLVLALVVVLVRRVVGGSADVLVQEELFLGGRAEQHDGSLAMGLREVRGVRFRQVGPGRYVLTMMRSPNWTLWFLPLFGLGFLLALVFMREWRLVVSLYDAEDGARVRLEGQTEQRVLERVRGLIRSAI